jgi:hypothetical protein
MTRRLNGRGRHHHRHPVRPQPQHRLGGTGRASGDHGREQNLAAVHDHAPAYKKVNPADAPIIMLSLRSDTLPVTAVDDYGDNRVAPIGARAGKVLSATLTPSH